MMTLGDSPRLWSMAVHLEGAVTMPDSGTIMRSLLEALPAEADARDELAALGAVAAGVISTTEPEGRADLVERFCATLRKSVAVDLN